LAEPEEVQRSPLVHFYVPPNLVNSSGDDPEAADCDDEPAEVDHDINQFLQLPQENVPIHAPLSRLQEPHVDYSFSHILTSDDFVEKLAEKAAKKEALMEEAKARKVA